MHARAATRVLSMLLWFAVGAASPTPSAAVVLSGDLNGDGAIDSLDEFLIAGLYGTKVGDALYDASADGNGDGAIDVRDLALFGRSFGTAGGEVDQTPPALAVTLNDVPDDMNDLLVVPPDGFDITIAFDGAGGAIVNPNSVSIQSSQPFGALAPGTELRSLFAVTQTSARLVVPSGTDLARTSHYLTVRVADVAGNATTQTYGFAVRDFPVSGAPFENEQVVFLDFSRNRSLGPEVDFVEDLRTFHLTSPAAPEHEGPIRDWVVAETLVRANVLYGRNPDGSATPASVALSFVATSPVGPHSRLCVGGASQLGPQYLGATLLDVNNVVEEQDECAFGSFFGVFPQALDDLWAVDPEFQAVFHPLDPAFGGTPVGEHALDAVVLGAGFDPQTASAAALARWDAIREAVYAFAQAIASAAAHEAGHLVGLVAHGPAPGGLYGGNAGNDYDHNVTPAGSTPGPTFLMNQGGSFTFAELTGRAGHPLPVFRPLNWAYLRDKVVLASTVTALYPAPVLAGATPGVVDLAGGAVTVTFQGDGFVATPSLLLVDSSGGGASEVLAETWVDTGTVTGRVDPALVPPGVYDVELVNPDGQSVVLPGALVVQ